MIKPGETAYVKFTEEPVGVLGIYPENWLEYGEQLSGTSVLVRRANQTKDGGLGYLVETFFLEELESPMEKLDRMAQLQKDYSKASKKAAEEIVNATPENTIN